MKVAGKDFTICFLSAGVAEALLAKITGNGLTEVVIRLGEKLWRFWVRIWLAEPLESFIYRYLYY